MKRFVEWWKKQSLAEKLMYLLLVALMIGIATRWRYVFDEIAEAFASRFSGIK